MYERFLYENLTNYVDTFLSKFISAYRSSHVLIRLIGNWKKSLGQKKIVGAMLINLLKAFDSMPHDLLIAKMHAYCFSIDPVTFFH